MYDVCFCYMFMSSCVDDMVVIFTGASGVRVSDVRYGGLFWLKPVAIVLFMLVEG